jgi:hypothetical protein
MVQKWIWEERRNLWALGYIRLLMHLAIWEHLGAWFFIAKQEQSIGHRKSEDVINVDCAFTLNPHQQLT